MRVLTLTSMMIFSTAVYAQNIEIVSVTERDGLVEISIKTDMATPFEVMAGIGLSGQADNDVFIGNNARQTITSKTQTLVVPASQRDESLPTGEYEAEVGFYPRWGAENSPPSTKAISAQVKARQAFNLKGSAISASEVSKRENLQKWVMLNTAIGDPFDLHFFQKKLGESETMDVANRNNIIKAHYFPAADMTLFENTLRRSLVTWRTGRTNRL